MLLFSGCSGDNSAEESVRRFLAEAETAVEEGHIRQVREYIADDYHDPAGRTKQELVNYLAYQVLGKRAIYLYTSVRSISFTEPDKTVVELLVAMTGSPADSRNILLTLQADIYSFALTLRKSENTWLLTTATWKPAMVDDLLPE